MNETTISDWWPLQLIGCIGGSVQVQEILHYLITNMYSSCPNLGYFI